MLVQKLPRVVWGFNAAEMHVYTKSQQIMHYKILNIEGVYEAHIFEMVNSMLRNEKDRQAVIFS